MKNYIDFLRAIKDKKVLVMGLGTQGGGVSVARFFASHGSQVTVTDIKDETALAQSVQRLADLPITYHLGGHDIADFTSHDIIIKGPSIRWDNKYVRAALAAHRKVFMESALFGMYCPAVMIGITGTRGKSTTTQLIYEALKATYQGGDVHLAGNIPEHGALAQLSQVKREDIVVLEVSSWQLSGFDREKISPQVAVCTNFYPDHLNYYRDMHEYINDKLAIVRHQGADDCSFWSQQAWSYAHAHHKVVMASLRGACEVVSPSDYTGDLQLEGEHNRTNAALAFRVCCKVLPPDTVPIAKKIIEQYTGLPYRQQVIARDGLVKVVNDSTSTSPVALQTALATFANAAIVLIMGGASKGLPYDELLEKLRMMSSLIIGVYLLPGDFSVLVRSKLREIFDSRLHDDLVDLREIATEAIRVARDFGRECTVLFSPGATSFAQFTNEFDRARKFDEAVFAILGK
jgi:UDP-N-acetylmuramoylalanine--D-glutamate ligase